MKLENKVVVHLTAASEEAAGKVTYDMHHSLLQSGVDSWIITPRPGPKQEGVINLHATEWGYKFYHYKRLAFSRLRGKRPVRIKRNPDYHFNIYAEDEYYSAKHILKHIDFKIDAIIIHFYDGFLDSSTISRLGQQTGARIFWLMMDMAPFTGGCHYSWGCVHYTSHCGTCPALYSCDEDDRSSEQWERKNQAIRDSSFQYVAGSQFQYDQARRSSLLRDCKIHKVLLGVDSRVYTPCLDKVERRKKYNIPQYKRIILFAATYLQEERKGYKLFNDMLGVLASSRNKSELSEICVLVIGKGYNLSEDECFEIIKYDFLNKECFQDILASVDVVVCPTLEDSGPSIVSQALMSGIPVVMFETGIAKDVVRDGVNGYSVRLGDVCELANACNSILTLSAADYSRMCANARNFAIEIFEREKIVAEWIDIIGQEKEMLITNA